MMRTEKTLAVALVSAAILTLIGGASQAQKVNDYGADNPDIDFCIEGKACSKMVLRSRASVVTTNTKITQESTNGSCIAETRTLKRNLSKSGANATVNIDPTCQYKVKFNTTSGCTGDKTAHMRPDDLESVTGIELRGGCGTLKTSKFEESPDRGVIG